MAEFITSRVILYKNGIGNFERKGSVEGDTTIELFFPSDAMNDILKSINVTSEHDHSRTLTYEVPSTSPTSASTTPLSTHKDLYTRLIRENVQVTTDKESFEGMVIAVDYDDRDKSNCGKISLFTKDNLVRTIAINTITGLQVPNSLVSQSKSLKINIKSSQKQDVKINYIRAVPVWTPTYRAILGASQVEFKVYGWATIHNPGPDDWKGTAVSLVAGQPVSFVNEVYKPKYKRRPKIQQKDTSSALGISNLLVSALLDEQLDSSSDSDDTDVALRKKPKKFSQRELSRSRSRSSSRSMSPPARGRARAAASGASEQHATASTSENVDLFRYDLSTRVDLTHGHSALVPIFESIVQGRKLALYNSTLHPEHAFSTLVMSNTTGLTLEAGSITVFDGDMYIGEAHLQATKPNERRFLPFALELGIVVKSHPTTLSLQNVHHVTIQRGRMTASRKCVKVYKYTITNKLEKEIELLLEHPKEYSANPANLSLIVEECYHGPDKSKNKIEVKTEYVTGTVTGNYGLAFVVPARSTTTLVLHSQTVDTSQDGLRARPFFVEKIADFALLDRVSKVMEPFWMLKDQCAEVERSLKIEKEKIAELEKSQTRARSNVSAMSEVERQRKYSEQIDKLEDEITQAQAKVKSLNEQLHKYNTAIAETSDSIYFDSSK